MITQFDKKTYPVVCLDVPACPEQAVPFLCVSRPHLSCMSQKHHSQIQTQTGWWRSPLHPFITETEGGLTVTTLILVQLLLNTLIFLGILFFKNRQPTSLDFGLVLQMAGGVFPLTAAAKISMT